MRWTRASVDETKESVKAELGSSDGEPLQLCKDGVARLEGCEAPQDRLRRLIYVISALVHHERRGGLSGPEVNSLLELGDALITMAKGSGTNNVADGLQGELHMISSQIQRKRGNHWRAAWLQNLAGRRIASKDGVTQSVHQLGQALRNARAGNVDLALGTLERCDLNALPLPSRQRLFIEMMACARMLRLRDKYEYAKARLADADDRLLREIQWQDLCFDLQESGDFAGVVKAIKGRGSHAQNSYFLEGWLRLHATSSTRWLESKTKITSRVRTAVDPRDKSIFRCARAIEDCYDKAFPLELRIQTLGDQLDLRHHLITVEQELIFLGAASTWLFRINATDLGLFTLNEYMSLSHRVCGREDYLGTLHTMIDRHRFRAA